MLENGFEPDFPPAVRQQLAQIKSRPPQTPANVRDLRDLLWSSIDNDTSRDLDQIEYAEKLPDGTTKVLVGVADVDAFVPKGSPIDAQRPKKPVRFMPAYTFFPMLPEELSTDTTSLLEVDGKLSMVVEFVVDGNGSVTQEKLYPAIVTNKAQLAYNAGGSMAGRSWIRHRQKWPRQHR